MNEALKVFIERTIPAAQPSIIDAISFAENANLFWKSCVSEAMTPKEFGEKMNQRKPRHYN